MSNVAVQINDLTKVFPNGTRALDGVTLNVPETEYQVEESTEYTLLQKDFLTDVTKAYYAQSPRFLK